MEKEEYLKLEHQLCFPLYATSKEIIRHYQPLLEKLDLTYTQYICMLVLWEYGSLTLKSLGDMIFLDSGTLTPLIKKLEEKGYVERYRMKEDERNLVISLTKKGQTLKEKALDIPLAISSCIPLSKEEAIQLHQLLYKILNTFKEDRQ